MVWNAADIREGMEVLGLDGRCIGRVTHVWLDLSERPDSDLDTLGHHAAQGLMPLEQVSGTASVEGGYFLVEPVEGEMDGPPLYVPFGAVQILFPGQNVTLSWASDECRKQYGRPPVGLGAPAPVAVAAATP